MGALPSGSAPFFRYFCPRFFSWLFPALFLHDSVSVLERLTILFFRHCLFSLTCVQFPTNRLFWGFFVVLPWYQVRNIRLGFYTLTPPSCSFFDDPFPQLCHGHPSPLLTEILSFNFFLAFGPHPMRLLPSLPFPAFTFPEDSLLLSFLIVFHSSGKMGLVVLLFFFTPRQWRIPSAIVARGFFCASRRSFFRKTVSLFSPLANTGPPPCCLCSFFVNLNSSIPPRASGILFLPPEVLFWLFLRTTFTFLLFHFFPPSTSRFWYRPTVRLRRWSNVDIGVSCSANFFFALWLGDIPFVP